MPPIAQALPVHPAARRGLLAGAALKNQRQSQHPARRRGILAARRRPPQPGRIQLPTGDLNRSRHPIPHISTFRDRIEQNLVWQHLRVGLTCRWYYAILRAGIEQHRKRPTTVDADIDNNETRLDRDWHDGFGTNGEIRGIFTFGWCSKPRHKSLGFGASRVANNQSRCDANQKPGGEDWLQCQRTSSAYGFPLKTGI